MANWREMDWLLGQTFETRFTVLSIGDDPERTVVLAMPDGRYRISLAELTTIIESGFVVLSTTKGVVS